MFSSGTPRTLGFGVLAFAIFGGVTGLEARPEYFSAWGTLYGGSSSDNNASCNLCHGGGGFGTFNPYGWRVREVFFGGGTIEAAIRAVESEDSDADPSGSSNLDEINANAQPGWTDGPDNTIFTSSGSSTSGNNPPVIPGDLDPPVASGAIDVSPLTLAFASVDIGMMATLPATIQNVGAGDLDITGLSVTGTAEFSVSQAAPIALAPGDSLSLSVVYAPLDSGDDAGTLVITSNDPDAPQVQVDLSGTGTQPPIQEPDIAVSPLAIPFGELLVGDTDTQLLTVQNLGTASLSATLTVAGAGFGASPLSLTLPPSGSVDVEVNYTPLVAGAGDGVLSITSNDPDEPVVEISLSGTGVEPMPDLPSFIRGDCNDDGSVDIADAVCMLNGLFGGGVATTCEAALNTNGDAAVNISDPVSLLNFLFGGGSAPVAPFPECGPGAAESDGELDCATAPRSCQ